MKKTLLIMVIVSIICLTVTNCGKPKPAEIIIDVDLTKLSGTMVYAEVYKMMTTPNDYLGKTIKVSGPYSTSNYLDEIHHFVLVEGVDACCPEGLLFVWNGNHSFPDDYPKYGTQIEIVGVFASYAGFDFPYNCIEVDDLIILD